MTTLIVFTGNPPCRTSSSSLLPVFSRSIVKLSSYAVALNLKESSYGFDEAFFIHRFHDKGVSAGFERSIFRMEVTKNQDHDCTCFGIGLKCTAETETIQTGHEYLRHHNVGMQGPGSLKGCNPIRYKFDDVSCLLKKETLQSLDGWIALNH